MQITLIIPFCLLSSCFTNFCVVLASFYYFYSLFSLVSSSKSSRIQYSVFSFSEFKLKEREEFRFVSTTGAPQPDSNLNFVSDVVHRVENEILEEIMKLEERVYSASLQVKIRDRQDDQQANASSKVRNILEINLKCTYIHLHIKSI